MNALARIGFCFSLSITNLVWLPQARSEAIAPPAPQIARDLSEYVYLHVTRSRSIAVQSAMPASMCRGTSRKVQS